MATLNPGNLPTATLERRDLVIGSAWALPAVVAAVPAQATTCSVQDRNFFSADLKVVSVTGRDPSNGHTVGTFTFRICNNGTLPIPSGTQYTVTLTAEKAPGDPSGDKNIAIGPPTSTGATASPPTGTTLNPNQSNTTITYTITTTTPIAPGACTDVTWTVDTATGIGATRLVMTATLVAFGGGVCSFPAPGNQSSISGQWGKDAD